MRHISLNPGRSAYIIMILILSLRSCEKEVDPSNLILSSEDPISYIYWSESSDKILYSIEDPSTINGLSVSLNIVDISTKETRKVIDFNNHAGYRIYLNNNKIYYTDYLDQANIKLFSLDISGQNNELVRDSLGYVQHFSKKYLVYLKNQVTSCTTVLYDLVTGSEKTITTVSNNFPLSISPDGNLLMLGKSDNLDGIPILVNTMTGDITGLILSYYSSACGYYWKEEDVYAMYLDVPECYIKNMRTGEILISSEDINNECSCTFSFSPSGQYIYHVKEVRTEQGKLEKSYLNLVNSGTREKIVIDLLDKIVYGVKFSPDETQIAFIGNSNKIYILNL
jgi:hypothetical protein